MEGGVCAELRQRAWRSRKHSACLADWVECGFPTEPSFELAEAVNDEAEQVNAATCVHCLDLYFPGACITQRQKRHGMMVARTSAPLTLGCHPVAGLGAASIWLISRHSLIKLDKVQSGRLGGPHPAGSFRGCDA
uniref:Uncharacterized protein n=1 Tax=Bionectria ochroleuca TaxID=29856 RepID=A0A8H7N7S0_BIOOC